MLSTYQVPYRASWIASAMLFLTVLQGTSFTLTLAIRGPLASDAAASMVTLLWLMMYLAATLGLIASSGINWVTWMVRYRLALTLLVAGAAFSAAWSVDIGLTIERAIHLIGTTLVAVYLGFKLPLAHMLRFSAALLGVLMLASIGAALLLPDVGLENYEGSIVWAGVMASKNTLGFWAAISVLLSGSLVFWQIPLQQKAAYCVLTLASLVCLYFSVSATSLLAMTTAAAVMIYLHAAFSLRLGMISMIVLGVFMASLAGLAFHFIDTAELIGRSGDLTGRGDVWAQTWKLITERPMTGVGYGTLWYPTAESVWIQQSLTEFTWTVYHAHNGLLQVASEIGLPLTALAVFMIVQQLVEILYCQYKRQQPGVLFVLGFTIALVVSNYSEARLLVHRELYWVFFIALPISMLQQVNLFQTSAGVMAVPASLPPDNSDRLKQAREELAQRRTLKKRLRKRRVTIINAPSDTKEKKKRIASRIRKAKQRTDINSVDAKVTKGFSANTNAANAPNPEPTDIKNVPGAVPGGPPAARVKQTIQDANASLQTDNSSNKQSTSTPQSTPDTPTTNASIPLSTPHSAELQTDSQDMMKRKLARRHRKAG